MKHVQSVFSDPCSQCLSFAFRVLIYSIRRCTASRSASPAADLLTMKPKSPDVGFVTAFPRRARLMMLNASRRRSNRCVESTTLKPFAEQHVHVPEAGLAHRVLFLRRGERARRGRLERVLVEPDRAGAGSGVGSGPHSVLRVASGSPTAGRRTGCRCPARRRRRRHRRERGHRTAPQTAPGRRPIHPSCRTPSAAAPTDRRVSGIDTAPGHDQHVRAIEIRDAVVAAVVEGVGQESLPRPLPSSFVRENV